MKVSCILFVVQILRFRSSYALNEACNTTQQCIATEKTECIDLTCQCDNLSKFNDGLNKCLSYATEYGTLCYKDSQCIDYLGDNLLCLNNACICQTEYRWYQGKCQKYAGKGEPCTDDVICLDGSNPLSLTCEEKTKTCQCSEGYYDRVVDCRIKSKQDFPCAINSDCFPSKDIFNMWVYSHCELGKCIKNTNQEDKNKTKAFNDTFSYSKASSYLKKLIVGDLQDSTTTIPDTKCPNGVSSNLHEQECLECPNTRYYKNVTCICEKGFFLQDGQCIAELGMKDPNTQYVADKDCPLKPGKLVDGVCYCRDFWFQSETNRECKKTTLEYTKSCLDNDWCKAMGPYAYCNTDTEQCSCISQAVLNETSFYCELKPDANVTQICLDNSACPLYETCANEACQCDDGFFRVNDTSLCLPKIGFSCEVRDCNHITNAVCSDNETCQCKSSDFVSNGSVCLEKVTALNEKCQIQQQCENIPHSDCLKVSTSKNVTSQCLCVDEYLDVEGICYPIKTPGSQCSTEFNCTVILGDTFECRNNLCQCPRGTTLSKNVTCVSSSANSLVLFSVLPLIFIVLFVV